MTLFLTLCTLPFVYRANQKNLKDESIKKISTYEWTMIFLFLVFFYRQFFWVYFYKNGQMMSQNVNNYGDLPLHITYIQSFVKGMTFWPENPIYSATKLHYPVGVDFFSAMLLKLRITLESSMPLMGFFSACLFVCVLLKWAGGFGIGAFLFSGGLSALGFLQNFEWKDYQAELAWKSLPLALYIPQRGFLYAFPVGLLLLWSWQKRFVKNEKALPFWLEGLFWGLMPLFHLHSFIALSLFFAVWAVWSKKIKEALPILAVAFIPATLEVLFLTEFFTQASLIWFKPGWMIQSDTFPILIESKHLIVRGYQSLYNVIYFFFNNFGLYIPLTMIAWKHAKKNKRKDLQMLLYPSLALFLICFFVMFAPWEWDNTKLMVWAYLLLLPVLNEIIQTEFKLLARRLLLFGLFFTGAITCLSAYHRPEVDIHKVDEVTYVCAALKDLPQGDVVAVSQTFNHPVALCGQQMLMGYAGHLWSYGIKSSEREEKFKIFMNGSQGWQEIAKQLNIKYVFWGAREVSNFPESKKPWAIDSNLINTSPWGQLYRIGAN
jgi:hypothetical protein